MDGDLNFNGPLGLCEKIRTAVGQLTESAIALQVAIMDRRSNAIWAALAEHQTQVLALERLFQLWTRLFNGQPSAEDDAVRALRAQIRAEVDRLSAVERVNARLSLTYLGAVRKVLAASGVNLAPRKNSYDANGRHGRANTSVLVNRLG